MFFLKGYDINNCLLYKLNVFYDFIFLGNEDIHYLDKNNGDFFFRDMKSLTFYVLIEFIVEVVNAPAVLVIEVLQQIIINYSLSLCKSSHETPPNSNAHDKFSFAMCITSIVPYPSFEILMELPDLCQILFLFAGEYFS